jgi:hypothetical protein
MANMRPPTNFISQVVGLFEPETHVPDQVAPREFLAWAEKDLSSGDKRGRGNALGNVKKALHSRVDEIIAKTHVRFTNDWNPTRLTTEQKLNIVRQLGVQHEAIVDVMTFDRNEYEHAYIVPPTRIIQGHLHAAQLWLEKTYTAYEFRPLGFVGLPLLGVSSGDKKPDGSSLGKVRFGKPQLVLFFYNAKKQLLTIKPDGLEEYQDFESFDTKQMIALEAPHIRQALVESRLALNEASLVDMLERYRRWVAGDGVRKDGESSDWL